ncbi:hypothetical protein P775_04540 [Puniceibacterium antarcticum]|uniref:Calcineurin-like phosphoesterase domain-containing protein n=1 Tax=Puniceibacterium antarcticum TaxID=1206336 RepID=A0A2G8RIU8_9RHOB|nr:metallophosphoesterase [Puniceibacterium antarcticum]PIL21432.1 hypothetical protein P775_04540 [Puniceibacterium antarcticum]
MSIFFWKRAPKPTFDALLAPDQPFFAVGDIHGRLDLLQDLLRRLEKAGHAEVKLVCVGDYIDRGDQSREVLNLLQSLQADDPGSLVCLLGNHEQMLLDFLEDPARSGPRWLLHGGLQTFASYGISPLSQTAPREEWEIARNKFREVLGNTEGWLRGLPRVWQTGNVAVVHAAADPALPIDKQTEKTLLWGHKDFGRTSRQDGIWVVHGHTIVDHPKAINGRISVDTGGYATGLLTAALVEQGSLRFL